ncbi:UNVERIFIED_ORG: UDP-glucose 4-epimerase [Gordonia westfalica J30]
MKIMVTGGLGVNGAWVVRTLLERGHDVVAFDSRADTSLISDIAEQVEIVVGDICDAERLAADVSRIRPDRIVHLAAFVDCERFPLTAVSVNIDGTANVCAAAAASGVRRVVFTSSKAVYAPATGEYGYPTYRPIREPEHLGPIGMYGITKVAGENILEWYGRTTSVECVSLRFGTIYGPGRLQRHHGAINTYSAMIELPASGQPFTLDHGGDEADDMIYVLDAADAVACVALADEAPLLPAYNVSSGRTVSMYDFGEAIRRIVPAARLKVGPGLDPMDQDAPYYMALDGARLAQDYGWRSTYDTDRAVEHYHELVASR